MFGSTYHNIHIYIHELHTKGGKAIHTISGLSWAIPTLYTYAPILQHNFSHGIGTCWSHAKLRGMHSYIILLELPSNSKRFALLRLSHPGSYPGFSIGKVTTYIYVNCTVHTGKHCGEGKPFLALPPSKQNVYPRRKILNFNYFSCVQNNIHTDIITFS